jgi:uncharacterized repeat protein (TIGR03803 family)
MTITAQAVVIAFLVLMAPLSQAQTYTVLYRFIGGSDGAFPLAALLRDPAGNLYSTTEMGGDLSCNLVGCGTVFKLNTNGTQTVLHAFNGSDGYLVRGPLIRAPHGFYGISWQGGADGWGLAFQLDSGGNETVLYSFTGFGPDGGLPYGGLIRDSVGNLYGTCSASLQQPESWGTAFKLDPTGKITILHTFSGKPDGAIPSSGLIRDAAGNLYGTTTYGGASGHGTVFKMDRTGAETVLYSFTGKSGDGAQPYAGLIRDASGNLYGTTYIGGLAGKGTVFKLDASGHETVLHSFTDSPDGASPYAGLLRDASGDLYGTTSYGGAAGKGTVFKLDSVGKMTVLHSFTGGSDGENPSAALIMDASGNLYGTTMDGGNGAQCPYGVTNGCGTVFKLTP